jgi:drug/metabolite transporter (DMT)-like permease
MSLGIVLSALTPPKIGVNPLARMPSIQKDSFEKIMKGSAVSEVVAANESRNHPLIVDSIGSKSSLSTTLLKSVIFSGYMLLWYFFTVVYNISNKNALNAFPLPAVVSCLQLLIGLPLFLPFWAFNMPAINLSSLETLSKHAVLHALGILTSVMALEAGSVSFTHIVKSAEPVFAALFSMIFLQEVLSLPVYLSLLPIIGGVGMASMTDFTFSQRGFILAMLSNVFHQLRIVFTKQFMINPTSAKTSTTITPSQIFQILSLLSLIQLIPFALLFEGKSIFPAWIALQNSSPPSPTSGILSSLLTKTPFLNQFPSLTSEGVKLFVTNIFISGLSFFFQTQVILPRHPSLIFSRS